MSHDLPTKSDDETPVPSCWRPSLEAIVRAFVGGDFLLQTPIASVRPPSNEDAAQMREYVEDYGEQLVPIRGSPRYALGTDASGTFLSISEPGSQKHRPRVEATWFSGSSFVKRWTGTSTSQG